MKLWTTFLTSLWATFVGLALTMLAPQTPLPAASSGERDELLKAFSAMSKPGAPIQVRTAIDTPLGRARNIIQIWAELDGSDKKVSLAGYEWSKNEKFYLVFKAAIPVQVSLHNLAADGKKLNRVLPIENNPDSEKVIPAAQAFRLPIKLETEDDDKDERILLTIITIPDRRPVTFGLNGWDRVARENRTKDRTFRVSTEPPPQVVSDKHTDVAQILISKENRGTGDLVLRKKKSE